MPIQGRLQHKAVVLPHQTLDLVAAEWVLALSSNLPGVGGLLPPYSAHIYLHAGD